MIMTRDGMVTCTGSEPMLLADLVTIIKTMKNKIGIEKHFFDECVRIAFMSDEELDDELAKEEEKMKLTTLDAIKQLTDIFGEELVGEFLRDINKDK